MDIEAYRKDFLAQVERESATAETVSPDTMISYANTDDRDNETLCGMIRGLSLAPASFAASVRSLLEVLANDSLAAAPRLAALEQLGAAQFQPVEFAPFHAEFTEILRRLAFAKDKAIRTAALERLTLANDETAQRLLREGLEKTRKPLVSDAKAVQLLARDEHARPLPLLRKLATERTGAVREQALRALAGDSKSISLFETIAGDKARQRRSVRSPRSTSRTPRAPALQSWRKTSCSMTGMTISFARQRPMRSRIPTKSPRSSARAPSLPRSMRWDPGRDRARSRPRSDA